MRGRLVDVPTLVDGRGCRHDHTRGAKSALQSGLPAEALLNGGQRAVGGRAQVFTHALQAKDIHIVEANCPDPGGAPPPRKSDPLDAYSAARVVLAGHGLAVPKDPPTGAHKAPLIARRGAVKARTAAIQQIRSTLVTAPADLRERYRRYTAGVPGRLTRR